MFTLLRCSGKFVYKNQNLVKLCRCSSKSDPCKDNILENSSTDAGQTYSLNNELSYHYKDSHEEKDEKLKDENNNYLSKNKREGFDNLFGPKKYDESSRRLTNINKELSTYYDLYQNSNLGNKTAANLKIETDFQHEFYGNEFNDDDINLTNEKTDKAEKKPSGVSKKFEKIHHKNMQDYSNIDENFSEMTDGRSPDFDKKNQYPILSDSLKNYLDSKKTSVTTGKAIKTSKRPQRNLKSLKSKLSKTSTYNFFNDNVDSKTALNIEESENKLDESQQVVNGNAVSNKRKPGFDNMSALKGKFGFGPGASFQNYPVNEMVIGRMISQAHDEVVSDRDNIDKNDSSEIKDVYHRVSNPEFDPEIKKLNSEDLTKISRLFHKDEDGFLRISTETVNTYNIEKNNVRSILKFLAAYMNSYVPDEVSQKRALKNMIFSKQIREKGSSFDDIHKLLNIRRVEEIANSKALKNWDPKIPLEEMLNLDKKLLSEVQPKWSSELKEFERQIEFPVVYTMTQAAKNKYHVGLLFPDYPTLNSKHTIEYSTISNIYSGYIALNESLKCILKAGFKSAKVNLVCPEAKDVYKTLYNFTVFDKEEFLRINKNDGQTLSILNDIASNVPYLNVDWCVAEQSCEHTNALKQLLLKSL